MSKNSSILQFFSKKQKSSQSETIQQQQQQSTQIIEEKVQKKRNFSEFSQESNFDEVEINIEQIKKVKENNSNITQISEESKQQQYQYQQAPSPALFGNSQQSVQQQQISFGKYSPVQLKINFNGKQKLLNSRDFNPYNDAPFEINSHIPFNFIVGAFELVSNQKGENSKETMKEIMSNVFRSAILLKPDELILAYYFCTLRVTPEYIPGELGIGNELLIKAISKSCGKSDKQIRDGLKKIGDLGQVAAESKQGQRTMDTFFKQKKSEEAQIISLKRVMDTFMKIAQTKGDKSNFEKEALLMKLFFDAKPDEVKYIVRWIQKNLKIGCAELTFQSALSRALLMSTVDGKHVNYRNEVRPDVFEAMFQKFEKVMLRAVNEYPNHNVIIQQFLEHGHNVEKVLQICKIAPGIPVKPMLAKPTKDISLIFQRFEGIKFTCEYKYDGLRGQIHYQDGKCHIYSRNLEDMTETYPDIIEFLQSSAREGIQNFIMDTEIVAIDTRTNKILPFQTLSTRSRKNVDKNQIEIQVCMYMFDLLYFNNKSLLNLPLYQRRSLIETNFREVNNKLKFAQFIDTDKFEEVQELLYQSVKDGCEGLMVKTLDDNSVYEPAKRSFKWLKLKKDYIDNGMGDSLDVVPIGGYYGTGKRTGFYGSFLLAVYNEDFERYETICKMSTGISDEMLEKFYNLLKENTIKEPLPDYKITKDNKVEVWFNPCMVWEIKGADLQVSPVYTTAISELGKDRGIGLRFPRLLRLREDKTPTNATTTETILEMYRSQPSIQNMDFNDDENDFY